MSSIQVPNSNGHKYSSSPNGSPFKSNFLKGHTNSEAEDL